MAKCGRCGKDGATVAEIKRCYGLLGIGSVLAEPPTFGPAFIAPTQPEITDGMWKLGDEIYKVQWNLEHTNLYGKLLVVSSSGDPGDPDTSASFEYAPGAVRKLREGFAHKLTLEEAKEFGALYGTCCVCGRTLTNETSIEAGIGPICAGRLA